MAMGAVGWMEARKEMSNRQNCSCKSSLLGSFHDVGCPKPCKTRYTYIVNYKNR